MRHTLKELWDQFDRAIDARDMARAAHIAKEIKRVARASTTPYAQWSAWAVVERLREARRER